MPSTFIMKEQLPALLPSLEMPACAVIHAWYLAWHLPPSNWGSGMGRIRQCWDESGEYTVPYLVRCWSFSYKSESWSVFSFRALLACFLCMDSATWPGRQSPASLSASGLMLPSSSYSNILFPGSSQKTAVSWFIIYLSWSTSYLQHTVRIGISC